MTKKFEIRNSTAEFMIFQIGRKEDGVQVVYREKCIWCTQKAMAKFFDVGVPDKQTSEIIFETGELVENSVISKMEITTTLGY